MPVEDSHPLISSQLISAGGIGALPVEHVLQLQCTDDAIQASAIDLPIARIPMPVLNRGDNALHELWLTNEICGSGRVGDIDFRISGNLLFGNIAIDETKLDNSEESTLRRAAEIAYRQIFSLLTAKDFPYLWRTWNYLPRIHAEENGLERYRQFNIGRHDAFTMHAAPVEYSPAASALGVNGGVFSVAFIAGRIAPLRIENPRQISAFAYPRQYGPRSPTFTRAALIADEAHAALLISGTASIVGHETLHAGDVEAQTRETVANLAVLLEQANARSGALSFSLENLCYRVYIRRANDYSRVREALETLIGNSPRAIYLQADICREDLLVEIEAFATRPLTSDIKKIGHE